MQSHSGLVRLFLFALLLASSGFAQLVDNTLAPNTAKAGINKSLADEIGVGRGDTMTPYSSLFIINRDPFRAIRRGRQIFQRKFTRDQGQGPNNGDGHGDINTIGGIGAGLSDSCASCHGRPRGSAGAGGDVATRPDSRDAPHLFGLGLREMLADEITSDLRAIRAQAIATAQAKHQPVTRQLISKTISYGAITANPDGTVDISKVSGVNPDLRVRPFFAEGSTISMREFLVGAFRNEMGIEAADPDLLIASSGGKVTTPSGWQFGQDRSPTGFRSGRRSRRRSRDQRTPRKPDRSHGVLPAALLQAWRLQADGPDGAWSKDVRKDRLRFMPYPKSANRP